MIHTTYKQGDPDQRMKVGIGRMTVELHIYTQFPPDNRPDDEQPTIHIKISDPK